MNRERNKAGQACRGLRPFWPVLFGFCLLGPSALAQTSESLTIRVEEGDTLRDLAAEHLGDPDLWTEILRANGLNAITDVHPGLELRIPAARGRAGQSRAAGCPRRHPAGHGGGRAAVRAR